MSLYPADFVELYRREGLWLDETFATFFADAANRFSDAEAVVGPDHAGVEHRLTYRELADYSAQAAGVLAAHGVGQGDFVVVQLPNIVEYVVAIGAVFRLGARPVFALPAHRQAELEAKPVPAAQVDPLDIAFLQVSGGTTGIPKLIPRSHADYLYSVRESARICELTPETRFLVVLPVSHNFTMSSPGILGVLWSGGTIVLCPEPTPSTSFTLVARERITLCALVPPLALAWLAMAPVLQPDLSSLKVLQVGGAKFTPEAAKRITPELGCRLQQVFGMAEGLVNYTRPDDSEELVIGTQGRPMSPFDEVRVVDDAGNDVPPGERGRLLTRGPYTIRGYWGGVDQESFTEDGFYASGDLVRQLPSGHLIVEGRDKDQINRGGEKISAEEIEDHLISHDLVHDAAIIAVPDRLQGERSYAFVVLTDGARLDATVLRDYLRKRGVADYKIPDYFEFAESFPTTGVGKTNRRELRRIVQEYVSAKTQQEEESTN